ncbi:two-component regulator propeller domain-containing protein, partial [Calditrichota bacterium]
GLSHNNITWILQDNYGFMWIGTEDGLNKFDGYKFTVYRHDPDDSSSLKSNWITSLYEDQAGVIWITTLGAGLFRFDREKENFIHFKPPGLATTTINQVGKYQYGTQDILWIGGYTGLFKIDLATSTCIHYPHTNKDTPYNWVQAIQIDSTGMVWIGTRGDGLHKFDPETEQFKNFRYDPINPASLGSNNISSLMLDKKGILWIGTDGGGLNKYDSENEQFLRYQYDPDNPNSLSSNNILHFYEDQSGLLWIGTKEAGLNRFDSEAERFTQFKSDPGIYGKLSDNTVLSIYEDKTGVFWIGTFGGLNKFDPNKSQFSGYKKIPGDPNSLCDNYITSIYESTYRNKKVLWVGTKNGLNSIDRETGRITTYQHDPSNSTSIPSNIISSIFEDQSGILWIGTLGDGLIKFDLKKEKFTQYLNDPDDPKSIRGNIILCVFEDKYDDLWIGNTPTGLCKLNRETEEFTQVGARRRTTQIYEDKGGELWFTTWPGLRKLDRQTGKFNVYWRNREASNYPESYRHNCIHEPNSGEKDILWVGSYNGLNKFDCKSGSFFTYTVEDGLPNNIINGILEDNQGNLWLSTNNGLSRFNQNTGEFRNFDVNDGLLSNQFYPGAFYKSSDGEMFFGSSKGLIAFYPERLIQNPDVPNILITDFKIFNEPIPIKNENSNNKENI